MLHLCLRFRPLPRGLHQFREKPQMQLHTEMQPENYDLGENLHIHSDVFLFRRITLFFHAHGGRSNLAALRQYTISAELGRIPPRQAVSVSVSVHYYAKITENQVTKSRIIKKKWIPSKIINKHANWYIYTCLWSKLTLWFLPGVWSPDCPHCDQRILCCGWRQGIWDRGPSGCLSAECGPGPYIQRGSQAARTHLRASAWIHSSWDPNGYGSKGETSGISN